MLDHIIDALRSAGVEPSLRWSAAKKSAPRAESRVERFVDESLSGSENVLRALRAWPDDGTPFLYATSDLPYVDADAVRDFVARSARRGAGDCDLRISAISDRGFPTRRRRLELRWPANVSSTVGFFSIPAAFRALRRSCNASLRRTETAVAHGELVSPLAILRFASRALEYRTLEAMATSVLVQGPATAVRHCAPELGFDVDTVIEYQLCLRATLTHFRLALFWLGIQAVWGALLGDFTPIAHDRARRRVIAVIAYGRLATAGADVAAMVQILVGFWSDARRAKGSRRIEFYTSGAIGVPPLPSSSSTTRAVSHADHRLHRASRKLNVAIGPYQAIIPDFVRTLANRHCIVVDGCAAKRWKCRRCACREFDRKREIARLGARDYCSWNLRRHVGTGPAYRCATPVNDERLSRVTRPFVDLFVSRALVYVGFYTLLVILLFYVEGCLGTPSLAAARRETGDSDSRVHARRNAWRGDRGTAERPSRQAACRHHRWRAPCYRTWYCSSPPITLGVAIMRRCRRSRLGGLSCCGLGYCVPHPSRWCDRNDMGIWNLALSSRRWSRPPSRLCP